MDTKIARNLSLKQIRAFVCVAKHGSFSQAAQELAISQPALTLSIQQFEEIVGVALLHRTTRSVSLTRQGREFLPNAEKILNDIQAAIFSVRASAERQENRIKVALLPSIAIRILPEAMRCYAEVSPETSIHMQDDNGRGIETQILNGTADFGISNKWSGTDDLDYTPFMRDRLGLICRGDHPLAHRQGRLNWSSLHDLPFVGMAADTGISRLTGNAAGLPLSVTEPAYRVLTIAALVGIVEHGEAVSALPALAAPDYLNPSLVFRELSEPLIYRDLYLITVKNRGVSKATAGFMQFLCAQSHRICAMFPNDTVECTAKTD
ncbi:LysR family transcriptional regulator [Pelagibius sp. Alg239-R121]|uniref:LysR family transcriptional regulator n=1 Tax=Pelagibius sp. Alg239-R121 TaxID=2993448 RepID=UPI0024A6CA08|nr:LysR family transcriptional regulator [Pelagibius sp. Alg239-R121]